MWGRVLDFKRTSGSRYFKKSQSKNCRVRAFQRAAMFHRRTGTYPELFWETFSKQNWESWVTYIQNGVFDFLITADIYQNRVSILRITKGIKYETRNDTRRDGVQCLIPLPPRYWAAKFGPVQSAADDIHPEWCFSFFLSFNIESTISFVSMVGTFSSKKRIHHFFCFPCSPIRLPKYNRIF